MLGQDPVADNNIIDYRCEPLGGNITGHGGDRWIHTIFSPADFPGMDT